MKILYVYNLFSGNQDQKQINYIYKYLSCLAKVKRVDIRDLDQSLIDTFDPGILVVAGGDGTVNSVLQFVINTDIKFGIIPLGTYNYTASFCDIPDNIEQALELIKKGKTQFVDIGKINQFYFSNAVSMGVTASYAYYKNKYRKNFSRSIAALIAIIITIIKYEYLEVFINKKIYYCLQIHIAPRNLKYKFEELKNPSPQLTGNNLSISMIRYISRVKLFLLVFYIISNKIQNYEEFLTIGLQEIEINKNLQQKYVNVSIDGEVKKIKTPLKIKIMPKKLRLITK